MMRPASVWGWIVAGILAAIIFGEYVATRNLFENHQVGDQKSRRYNRYCGSKFWSIYRKPPTYGPPYWGYTTEERKYELCQQWRSAHAAEEQAIIGWVQIGIGVAGLVAVALTTVFAYGAAKWARNTWRMTERPWIMIETVALDSDVDIDETACTFRIACSVKNIGRVPATNVHIHPLGFATRDEAVAHVMGFSAGDFLTSEPGGITIFPDQESDMEQRSWPIHIDRADRYRGFPAFIIMIEYRSPNHESWHVTTIVREVGVMIPDVRGTWGGLHWEDGRVPASTLDLITAWNGNRAT